MSKEFKEAIEKGKVSLGIEFGSTRIKAVLIDDHFTTISSGSYDWENQLLDGYWTYGLDDIINGLQETFRRLSQDVWERYRIPLQKISSVGISAMMQGYIVLNRQGKLLVPFRTWRNTRTAEAADTLTKRFCFKIPQRWSIAHLYQAVLNDEVHVKDVNYITTLSGYIHWRLTGSKVIGIGDASGMFPVDVSARDFNLEMINTFDSIVADKEYPWKLRSILPTVLRAGESAGSLTEEGVQLLDPTGTLKPGIPFCPPEGDAGTGMVATNSVRKGSGNISVGTSIFAMFVLDKELSGVYKEIDIVNTPDAIPVAMVLANNCSTDINAWVNLFREFSIAMGNEPDLNQLYAVLFNKSLEGDSDGGGMLSYGYYSGEIITGFSQGRPLFVRSSESRFTLSNFMRMHLYAAFATLRLGMDILTQTEKVSIISILAHGGVFKTPVVAQKICAAALKVPVSVMSTAGEGGAWGIAVLAAYSINKEDGETLTDYLANKVFLHSHSREIFPDASDVEGFDVFLKQYQNGLPIVQAALDHFK